MVIDHNSKNIITWGLGLANAIMLAMVIIVDDCYNILSLLNIKLWNQIVQAQVSLMICIVM